MSQQGMFLDSMLEVSWAQRSRRSLTTLTSFGLEAVIVCLLLLVPLLRTVGLPSLRTVVSTPISMGRRDVQPLAARPHSGAAHPTAAPLMPAPFMQPANIPVGIDNGPEESSSSAYADSGPCVGCVPGPPNGMPDIGSGTRPVVPAQPPAAPQRVFRTSSILQGMLIHQVQPVYPPLARTARIQGTVVLAAVISKAGAMEDLRVLRGHPMLVGAAIEAVRQWRYRPYILNDEPIEVETQITVNFTLGGN